MCAGNLTGCIICNKLLCIILLHLWISCRVNNGPPRSSSGNPDVQLLLSLYQKEVKQLKEQERVLGKEYEWMSM